MSSNKRAMQMSLGIFMAVAMVVSTLAQGPAQAPVVMVSVPNRAPNTGSVWVTIYGSGFQDGAGVKLTRVGQADINATGVVVLNAALISCDLNLLNAQPGAWNIVVTNADAQSGTLVDGFTVTAPVFLPRVTLNWQEEEPPPPSCNGLGSVQNWTGQVTFSFSISASSEEDSMSFQHSATVDLQMAPDYQTSSYVAWQDSSLGGTGDVNDVYTDAPSRVETLVGSGALYPGGPTQDDPGASLGLWLPTCTFEFYLHTAMPALYTVHTSTGDETYSVGTGVGLMDINDILITQLSGSRTVPAVYFPIDEPSWFVPGSVFDSDLELMVGNNFGEATVSWSFAPAD